MWNITEMGKGAIPRLERRGNEEPAKVIESLLDGPKTLSQIEQRTGLLKGDVLDALITLKELEYVVQDKSV